MHPTYKVHYETTGKEVNDQTEGAISHFVAGMGITGTLMKSSKRLKEYDRNIRIIAVEPRPGHKIQNLKNVTESIIPGIYDPSRLDEKRAVHDDNAFETTRGLAVEEGIFVGMSSGAALWVALEKAKELNDGTIVVILPDRGDRYLGTSLFTSV